MDKIRSNRHPLKFYFALFIVMAVILLFASFLLDTYLKRKEANNITFLFLAILVVSLGLLLVYKIFKTCPTIKITESDIYINKASYKLSYIKSIKFADKHFHPLFRDYLEGAKIVFKNNRAVYIYDDFYSNAAALKVFLDYKLNNKIIYTVEEKSGEISNQDLAFDSYKGNPFFSLRNISYLMIIAVMFKVIIVKSLSWSDLILFIFLSCHTVILIYFNYYFEMNDDYIVIKNHILFWKKTAYSTKDIREIVLRHGGSQRGKPNSLKIILTDYKVKSYYATSINEKTWLKFAKDIKKLKIKIR